MGATMDTLAIYEQFRAALGEEKAKGFAQTLGGMIEEAKNAATKDDIRSLRESLDKNVARIDAALANLAEAQARTEARLGRLEHVVEELAQAQLNTEGRLSRLEEALQKLIDITNKLVVRTDRHEGSLLELKFLNRLPSYLGLYLRRAKVLQPADLLDAIEPRLERADVLAQGLVDGASTYVVGDVS